MNLVNASNTDNHNVRELEGIMKEKLDQVEKTLKESLLAQVNENHKRIEEKLNEVMKQNKSYADVVKKLEIVGDSLPKPPENADLRSIIKEAKNEQLAEESDKKLRACNIILHGVNEAMSNDKHEAKKIDESHVNSLIETLGLEITYKSVIRLGKGDPTKKRPIKVVMHTEEDKNKIMSNLRSLKDKEEFKGISVTEDYTVDERVMIKEWREKAKANNAKESTDSQHVWKIRGTPKNGLRLMKVLKLKNIL